MTTSLFFWHALQARPRPVAYSIPCGTSFGHLAVLIFLLMGSLQLANAITIGNSIRANVNLNIRDSPSTSGTRLATAPAGSTGVVLDGPRYANGYTWWRISWNSSSLPTGWSVNDMTVISSATSGTIRLTVNSSNGSRLPSSEINAVLLFRSNGTKVGDRKSPSSNPIDFTGISYGDHYAWVFCWDMIAADSGNFSHQSLTTSRALTAYPKRPLKVTVYRSNGTSSMDGAVVRLDSLNGENGSWTERASGTTNSSGVYTFDAWPTRWAEHEYRIRVFHGGSLVRSQTGIKLSTGSSGSSISVTTTVASSGTCRLTVNSSSGSVLAASEMNAVLMFNSSGAEVANKKPPTVNPMDFTGISYGTYYFKAFCWDMYVAASPSLSHGTSLTSFTATASTTKRPLTVTAYRNDGTTPLSGATVRLGSFNGQTSTWTERASGTTGSNGSYAFSAWPTTSTGEKYRVLVESGGVQVGSNLSVQVANTTSGSSVPITTSVAALGTLTVTLEKPDGSAAPIGTSPATPRIELFTTPRQVTAGSEAAPAVFSGVAAGTYWVEGYHTGTFWGEEFWNSEQKQVLANQTNPLVLTRKYPRATTVKMFDYATNQEILPGQNVAAGTTVRFDVTVQNDVPNQALNTRIRIGLGRNTSNQPSSFLFDQTSNYKSIPSSGGISSFVFAVTFHENWAGQLHFTLNATVTFNTMSGVETRMTDSWGWTPACNIEVSELVGKITVPDPPDGGQPKDFPVVITRYDGGNIDPALNTWVIIHGRRDSILNDWAPALADAIRTNRGDAANSNEQILLVDWRDAAYSHGLAVLDFTREDRIEPVAEEAARLLGSRGFKGESLNLIGHSWGANVAAEIGKLILLRDGSSERKVRSIIALDSANDGNGNYNPDTSVNFGSSAQLSWAFRSSTVAGNAKTPETATEAFAVYTLQGGFTDPHGAIKGIFTDIIKNPSTALANYFSLDRLLSANPAPRPWITNQYCWDRFDPLVLNRNNIYEASILAETDGTRAWALYYKTQAGAPDWQDEIVRHDLSSPLTYRIIPDSGANGVISPSIPTPVNAGGSVIFSATPFTDYVVDQWLVNGSVVQAGGNNYTLGNVTADKTVHVTFKLSAITTYTVTPSAGANGSISPNLVQTVNSGGSIAFTATPFTGYVVDQWLVGGIVVLTGGSSYTLNSVIANKTVLVTFKIAPVTTYAVTPSAGANGSISPNSVQTVNSGGSIAFTATPFTGYVVDQWLVNGSMVQTGRNSYMLGNVAANRTVLVTFKLAPDITKPSVAITSPTSSSTHNTSIGSLNLAGNASDNVGVTLVTWSNDRGGSGTASGTNSWTVTGIILSSGQSILTVTARDMAGNTQTATLTVTYNAADTTKPLVTITSPVNTATYATSTSSLSLSGTASDAGGITQVTWTNDRGGNGTATGTTNWSISDIALSAGQNILTVSAWDANSNIGTDTLTVTYTPPEHPWKGPVTPLMVNLPGGRYFGVSFNRLIGALGNGIRIEGSANLRDWIDATPSMVMHGSPVASVDGIRETVTFRCPLPISDSKASGLRFLRLALVDSRVPVFSAVSPVLGSVGGGVTLSVTTTGNPATSYDWYRDWTLVGKTTVPQFQIPSLSTFTIGTYRVVAHNAYGSSTSSPFPVQAGGWTYGTWLTAMVGNGKTPTSPGYGRNESLLSDGSSNILKYAFGTIPMKQVQSMLPRAKILSSGGQTHLGIEFHRLLTPSDVAMRIEASPNLVSWRDVTAEMVSVSAPVPSHDGLSERVTFRCPVSLTQAESQNWRYLRVAVRDLTPSSPTLLLSEEP